VKAKTGLIVAAELEVSVNYQYNYENMTTKTDTDTYRTTASALYDMDPARQVCMKAKVVVQRGTATATRGVWGERAGGGAGAAASTLPALLPPRACPQ
jgi:hypothetical protein